jgi:hypothetical protein
LRLFFFLYFPEHTNNPVTLQSGPDPAGIQLGSERIKAGLFRFSSCFELEITG